MAAPEMVAKGKGRVADYIPELARASASDFGTIGIPPTHPRLLELLTSELHEYEPFEWEEAPQL
jgi:type III secretion system FlhB-like substrate exporter